MRIAFTVLFFLEIVALSVCAMKARKSKKAIGKNVAWVMICLIPPIIGNLIIIASGNKVLSTFGCFIYFIGMNLVIFAVLKFTFAYCNVDWPNEKLRLIVLSLLGIDVIQLLLNPFFHHAFDLEPIPLYGYDYFRLVPYAGQTFHRIVVYGIFFAVIIIFFYKMTHTSRIYIERYAVIFFSMVFTGLWQTFYIFSRTPMDRSMIGFGVFGFLVYYFSLYYHPTRLIDRMLAAIVSEMPEALFFFDSSGHCIWANKPGIDLVGIENNDFDQASNSLHRLFGGPNLNESDWSKQYVIGSGEEVKSYVLEKHTVADSDNHEIGSYMSIRDNTNDQRILQREMYKATHDSLTGVYNRAGYDLLLSNIDFTSTYMILIDIDNFKEINDTYGHETGDKILHKVSRTIRDIFRSDDYICRIGGDEFVVFMIHAGENQQDLISRKFQYINEKLADTSDGLPKITVSGGIAFGEYASDIKDWFEHADVALYEAKRNGKSCFVFYSGQAGFDHSERESS